jgi:hypothetical protein
MDTLAVYGDHLLVSTHDGATDWDALLVLDARAATEETLVATVLLGPVSPSNEKWTGNGLMESHVAVVGHYAYVVGLSGRLYVVDVSDPADPSLVDVAEEAEFIVQTWPDADRFAHIAGDPDRGRVYVAHDFGGLLAYDLLPGWP